MKRIKPICYLCGKIIGGQPNKDHVPPENIFPRKIKREFRIDPIKLSTHPECNESYSKDEEYFKQSLGPLAYKSAVGKSLLEDIKRTSQNPKSRGLYLKVLNEFDKTPGGIVLPSWMIAKRYDGKRIRRVLWKITRGLFYHENKIFLPENLPALIEIFEPNKKPSEVFLDCLGPLASRGKYGKVFDYKYVEHHASEIPLYGHYWGLLFWDCMIVTVMFHDPDCLCDNCSEFNRKREGGSHRVFEVDGDGAV
jgi:hypothetical protein